MSEITHLSKLAIQEPQNRNEVNDERDRVISSYFFHAAANVEAVSEVVAIAPRPIRIKAVRYAFQTVGGAAAALQVNKNTGTQAPAAGTALLSAASDLTVAGNVNTSLAPALVASAVPGGVLDLAQGDRVAAVLTGTLTGLTGLVVQVDYVNI